MRSLAYCTSGYNANNTHNVCVSGVCKVCNTRKCNFTEISQACRPYTNENATLQASMPHNSFVAGI